MDLASSHSYIYCSSRAVIQMNYTTQFPTLTISRQTLLLPNSTKRIFPGYETTNQSYQSFDISNRWLNIRICFLSRFRQTHWQRTRLHLILYHSSILATHSLSNSTLYIPDRHETYQW